MSTLPLVPGDATPLGVLARADEALYEAKRAGCDSVVVRHLEFARGGGPRLASWIEYIPAPIAK